MKNWRKFFKNYLYIILLICIVAVFFYPVILKNKIPLPADTIVGMYHPFRDNIWGNFVTGVPFKNSLITDSVRQQYVWRELAINQIEKGALPLWNPYSFAGTPLLANFQSAVFYPLNLLFFVMSFTSAWTILVILQPILAGVFLYFYLLHLKVTKLASFLGSTAFCFSGVVIAWLEWNTIVHVFLWLPLILLSIERLLERFTFKWVLIFLVASICQFFAGHLQFLFYSLLISNLYLILRVIQISIRYKTWIDRMKFIKKKYFLFLLLNFSLILLTLIQWLPTFKFINLSARNIDQSNFIQEGWFIPWQNLIHFLVPDFFGNPATGNYWGIWNYGEFIGFIGIMPLIFAIYALVFRFDKKVVFFGSLLFLSFIFALPTPVAYLPFKLGLPFISTSQPTRLIFVAVFALSILAALGFDQFVREKSWRKVISICIPIITIFTFLWLMVFVPSHFDMSLSDSQVLITRRNLILPFAVFVYTFISLMLLTFKKSRFSRLLTVLVFIVFIFEMLRFGWKFTPFSDKSWVFPQTKLLKVIHEDKKLFRVMALDRRILPPNFSVYYRLEDVAGYDPLYLLKYNKLVAAWERDRPDILGGAFNRIVTPTNYNNFITDLLGVKYILSYGPQESEKLEFIASEGQTYLYKNSNIFPRAFFVEEVVQVKSSQKVMDTMYKLQQKLKTIAVVQDDIKVSTEQLEFNETVEIKTYKPNMITLNTYSKVKRLLILSNIYYPSWKVTIDGKTSNLLEVDFLLQGVIVPKGNHIVEFKNSFI